MTLQDVLRDPPKLHGGHSGPLVLFKLSDDVLQFIDQYTRDGMVTLETGAGISTILFAVKRTHHICIVPDAEQVERIRAYCVAGGTPVDRVHFEIGQSETVLPRLDLPQLDLVLIDGRHGFPTPFIDWYYTARALRPGGLMVIDDTHLWTGDVLKRFLGGEPEWRIECDFFPRAVAVRKLCDGSEQKSWTEQEFLLQRTRALARANRWRRTAYQVRRAAELVRHAEFRMLARKVLAGL